MHTDTLGLKINVMQPRSAEPSNVAWHISEVEICGLVTFLQPEKCLFSHLQWTNVYMWMHVCVGGVITVLIFWLWVSGRLPAVQAHLVNETLRSIGWKKVRGETDWGREKAKKKERNLPEKVTTMGGPKRKIYRGSESHPASTVWWNGELMRSWWSIPSTAAAPISPTSPCPTLSYMASPWQPILAMELQHHWSRSEIPFSPRGF